MGDRPCCSAMWTDDEPHFDYNYVLRLPEPALATLLRSLRYPDLCAVKAGCSELAAACDAQIRRLETEFEERVAFKIERCAPDEGEEEMTERRKTSSVYYDGSVYLFGGEAVGRENQNAPNAAFNDLWKLNMRTMKWSRVMISGPPYPSPKSGASLVVWKKKLVLFGGSHPMHNGNMQFQSEVHYFDTKTSTWRYIANEDGPKLSGHTAVVAGDAMIVYGGWDRHYGIGVSQNTLHVYNLVKETWRRLKMESDDPDDQGFPDMCRTKSKMILIRPGLLLITGELDEEHGDSVLVKYNAKSIWKSRFEYKVIQVTGRWWKDRLDDDSALPNFHFHPIGEVRNKKTIRLVSLGRTKNDWAYSFQRARASRERYDTIQTTCREMCRRLKNALELEFTRREFEEEDESSCYDFHYQNARIHIDGCFDNNPRRGFKVYLKIDRADNGMKLDSFDMWEARSSIRAVINQLHSKYYNFARMDALAARVPIRNSSLKRLTIYTTEIDTNIKFDEFAELEWTPQPLRYPAPPETRHYSLVGAHHEVVMHSGSVKFNESMRRMGSTTLLEPTKHV